MEVIAEVEGMLDFVPYICRFIVTNEACEWVFDHVLALPSDILHLSLGLSFANFLLSFSLLLIQMSNLQLLLERINRYQLWDKNVGRLFLPGFLPRIDIYRHWDKGFEYWSWTLFVLCKHYQDKTKFIPLMIERRLWKFQITEARYSIHSNFFTCFALKRNLLDIKFHHFTDRITRCNLTINTTDAQLRLDSIQISLRYLDVNGRNVPTFMPSKTCFLLIVDPLLHGDLNVQLSLSLVIFKLNSILRLQYLKHLILILLARSFNGKVAVHPTPLSILLLHAE